jgi:hypothetical protein
VTDAFGVIAVISLIVLSVLWIVLRLGVFRMRPEAIETAKLVVEWIVLVFVVVLIFGVIAHRARLGSP